MTVQDDGYERQDEDRRLAAGLTESEIAQRIPEHTGVGSGIMPVYGDKTSLEKALEQAMREAREVVVCGIAPRPLVTAMESIVKDMRQAGRDFPWDHLHYITPVSAMILASRADVRLGAVVQQWQSALDGIRNCARQEEVGPASGSL